MDLRFALIGLGNIGREHVNSFVSGAINSSRLVAICANSLPAEYKIPEGINYYADYRVMLATEEVDVVLVATPTMTHKEIGLEVLKSGRHLLMEKPVGMTVLEADELANFPLQKNQKFGTVLNQRYDVAYRKIKSLISSGTLGTLQRINWTLTHWYRPDIYYRVSDWRGTWLGEGGGLLLNQCIHNLDVLQWLCGMPKTVWSDCSFGKYHTIEVEDEATVFMRFPNQLTAVFMSSTGEAPGKNQLDIVGDLGTLNFDGKDLLLHQLDESVREHSKNTTEMFSMPRVQTQKLALPAQENQHEKQIQSFVDSIVNESKLTNGVEEASKSIELANAILLSSWVNERVVLPLDRKRFQVEFGKRLDQSTLREKEQLDVTIDLQKSFR